VFSSTSITSSTGVDFGNSIFSTGTSAFLASSGTSGHLSGTTSNAYTLTSALNVNN
jgi:hypothetical protein